MKKRFLKLLIIGAFSLGAASLASPTAHGFSNAEIEYKLRYGISSAAWWDQMCRDTLRSNPGATFNSGGGGTLRQMINAAAPYYNGSSYQSETWLSKRGQGNASSPVIVQYGSTTVPLQINSVMFLCGPMVNPNYGAQQWRNAGAFANDTDRWVLPGWANDRTPNPYGGGYQLPAKTSTRILITGLEVVSGGGYVTGGLNQTMSINRSDSSRYWFSNAANINYVGNPVVGTRSITIRLRYKVIDTYYYGTNQCWNGSYTIIRYNAAIQWHECVNNTNDLSITVVPNISWAINASTTSNVSEAGRGEAVTFTHTINNTGPNVAVGRSGKSPYYDIWGQYIAPNGVASPAYISEIQNVQSFNVGRLGVNRRFDIPSDAPLGSQYCFRIGGWPRTQDVSNDSNWFTSSMKCVKVIKKYNLTPYVFAGPHTAAVNTSVNFGYSVSNRVGGDEANATSYQSFAVIVQPGQNADESFLLSRARGGCATLNRITGVSCSPIGSQLSRTFPAGPSNTQLQNLTENVALNQPVGSRVCRILMINSSNQNSASPANAAYAIDCVLVAAAPYVAITGGSSWAGGAYRTPFTGSAGYMGQSGSAFGSTGEYALFATGSINNFGSAGRPGANNLTFAKSPAGYFTGTNKISDVITYYDSRTPRTASTALPGGSPINLNSLASGNYWANTNIDIATSNIDKGKRLVVYAPNNTVTISGNITYSTTGVTSFAEVPHLVIIAASIEVKGAVERIDGNFYARDNFVSCQEGPRTSSETAKRVNITTSGSCNKQLSINGTLSLLRQAAGGRLTLNRSYGGTAAGQPAEIIRFRPESFLSTYELNKIQNGSVLTVIHEAELPARY